MIFFDPTKCESRDIILDFRLITGARSQLEVNVNKGHQGRLWFANRNVMVWYLYRYLPIFILYI